MTRSRSVRHVAIVFGFLLVGAAAFAQTQKPFQPEVGQPGKDVVWVPTCQPLVDQMLDLAKVTPQDFVVDLGSGDGRTVITAAKRGANALGVEYNPNMVRLSQENAAKAGVTDRATFLQADLFETDFSKATVVTMFLLPSINMKLRPKILDMKPGTRIVANTFTMEDWDPDQTVTVDHEDCSSWRTALLWIVPAKVDGTWKTPTGELTLQQKFQFVSGALTSGGSSLPIVDGRIRGDMLSFTAGGTRYMARVTGSTITGTAAANGSEQPFTATKNQ